MINLLTVYKHFWRHNVYQLINFCNVKPDSSIKTVFKKSFDKKIFLEAK